MRTERKREDKPEENAGKKRRMDRLSRMVKKPRQLAAVTAMVLVLAAVLCACTSTGAGGEGETPAPPEGVSTPPVVSTEPPPAPTESVTEPEPSQPEPTSTPEPEETPAALPPELGAAVLSDGSVPEGECVRYYCSGYGFLEYPSEADFLSAFGLGGAAPFFEHSRERIVSYGDDQERLCTNQTRLYCNEELGTGCVVQDSFYEGQSHKKGFVFEGIEPAFEDEWGRWSRWEMDPYSIPGLEGYQDSDGVEDYQEYSEYDDEGRLISFWADGIFASPWTNENDRNPVASLSLTYGEDGKLRERRMWRNESLFGTYQSSQHCYYDELGRVCYEDYYITHGREEFFYIYPDDGPAPAYCLYIDEWGSGVILRKY